MSISFDNLELAYSAKSDKELETSLFIFRLMNIPLLVPLFSKLTLSALKFHLPVKWVIKPTFFRQFCGGEDIKECSSIITRLGQSGICTTLDYAIENKYTEKEFDRTKEEIIRMIGFAKNNPLIKSISLKITGIAHSSLLKKAGWTDKLTGLTSLEKQEFENIKSRLNDICKKANDSGVQVFIDAEESPIQNAIDELSVLMMEKHNTIKPVVFISLQMYRCDRLKYLNQLIERAKKKNFVPGIKLVRGAYWQKETDRAGNSASGPIVYSKKEETDKAYNDAATVCLNNIERVALCAATHNEDSSAYLASEMKKLNIVNNHPHIQFSQLYGMSDHISYTLANAGYNVLKYLPYGPVRLVIPYLIRRAEENSAMMGRMGRELNLIIKEKNRRRSIK